MSYENLSGNWNYPNSIRAGAGTIGQLADCCKQLGMGAPLLITDPGLAALPMVEAAVQQCREAGLNCGLFSNIKGNPTGQNVMDGVAAYQAGNHDGVIAFGGGSGLDAAKAVALMVGQDRPLWDFEDVGDNWTRVNEAGVAPIVAVPTTAGTGSEVGRASVITDDANHIKKIIFHPKMLPSLVILDPELTVGLPPKVTAATGMDALSHNLEALCSPFYHPMAEGIAVEGIRLVKEYLPTAVEDGQNIEARMQMIVASAMGATAFQKGLGGMHALAHPLGALYDAHHGMLNAILMPYVLKANRNAIEERIERSARYLGLEDASFDGFLNWVLALREQVGIPHNLRAIGIDDSQADKVGQMATEDPSAGGNPIQFTAEQYADICRQAVRGEL
ncbi:iron-containing alcohol dehydrogenase [Marinobacterium arenosum]|uniref:iron-containing alcohol dehydrogenase n=1 Tax=Marinobacterium arenosum TaxID=2862496 RepID=UPI001C95BB37|nr:iron-containing alcohol dehydrogenase [Marinobacterium arenosum]MBY4677646.1 iron-containing alcohol dehydrogenase [Marinobacterium arenosum]